MNKISKRYFCLKNRGKTYCSSISVPESKQSKMYSQSLWKLSEMEPNLQQSFYNLQLYWNNSLKDIFQEFKLYNSEKIFRRIFHCECFWMVNVYTNVWYTVQKSRPALTTRNIMKHQKGSSNIDTIPTRNL